MTVLGSTRRSHRTGVAVLLVVICLIVITTLTGAMLRHFVLANRHRRQLERRAQAGLLAESAIERAVFMYRLDPKYQGEIWRIAPEQLGARHGGQVDVAVQQVEAIAGVQIKVTAVYPVGTELRAQVRKQINVRTKAEQD